ncbi:hypothetical protein HAX54_013792 [Datura stramonium]|uniref:NB-ARC domain-containing protein n=1 Tax=Datura stramonium TaxID=4076 RepID=A0ABS8TNQ2_DATST|nr:hypothetical protein [Datura stramonium]
MDVISIVGMAGLGKTSLACKVYNNCSITIHFDVRVWCTVSQTYNKRNLLLGILRQIMGDKSDNVDDPVVTCCGKHLMGRRYLVVLDDMPEPQAWDDLGLCFPCRENGSRIMVTTRNEELARYIKHHSDPYLLPFLRDEDSWELLQKKVFQGESCPSELLNVGPLVAKKCKGLPYLIIADCRNSFKKKKGTISVA